MAEGVGKMFVGFLNLVVQIGDWKELKFWASTYSIPR